MKEGRKPIPGPPGGEDDLSLPSSTSGEYVCLSLLLNFLFLHGDKEEMVNA